MSTLSLPDTTLSLNGALQLLQLSGHAMPSGLVAGSAPWLQAVIDGLCELSSRDALTGLANRRQFELSLAREIDRVARAGEPALVLMADVDHFKKVNDTYGHLAGDAVLKGVATCLSNAVRREDAVFRYGGEEFAVLLRETPLQGALILAERLRAGVERARHQGEGIPAPLQVTVSVGVAMLGSGTSDEMLIHTADQALYHAKHTGKNRVVHDGTTIIPGSLT